MTARRPAPGVLRPRSRCCLTRTETAVTASVRCVRTPRRDPVSGWSRSFRSPDGARRRHEAHRAELLCSPSRGCGHPCRIACNVALESHLEPVVAGVGDLTELLPVGADPGHVEH